MTINHNSNILTNVDQFGKFNILDYPERLEIIDETGYYIEILCPACGAKNFKITKKTGEYTSHSCDCMKSPEGKKEVMKAVLGSDWKDYSYSPRPNRTGKSSNQQKAKPAKINKIQSSNHGLCANLDLRANETITLGKLDPIPTDYPTPVKPRYIPKDIIATAHKTGTTQNQIQEITYQYSPTQFVKRFQWPNKESSKGHSKSFRQCHINDKKQTVWKKGDADWPLYRQAEAIQSGGWILFQEGEKCVEASRSLGIASVTTQGGNWDKANLHKSLKALQEANVPGIVFIGDNDEAGVKKATSLLEASLDLDFPVIVIPITQFWPEAPEKGDLADWITWGQTNNMYNPDLIRRLEEDIHRAVNERERQQKEQQHQPLTLPRLTKAEEVKLRIKLWLEEPDLTTKILEKSEICSQYRIDKRSFETIAAALDENSQIPKSKKYKVSEFTELPTGGSAIIMPGVPSIGVTILGGSPGSGKTTLMMDMAASIILGDEILGDNPARQGSVLFVSSDEPHTETQQKLINRGIADLEDGHMEIILNWDISQWAFLEEAVEEMRPTLILIDSFNAIHHDPNFDENSAQASYTIKKLEGLSIKYCTPIVLSHHLCKSQDNKGSNKLRGSTAIAASCSSIMVLDSMSDGAKKLSQPKIRGSEPLTLTLDMNVETGRFTILGEGQVDESTKTLGQKLTAFFNHHQGTLFEMPEICAQFPGETSKVVNNALNRLVKRGEIIKRPSKMNRRFKVYGIQGTDSEPSTPITTHPPTTSVLIDDLNHESLIEKGLEQIITPPSPEPVINNHPHIPTLPSDLNAGLVNHHSDSQEKELNSETLTETENIQIITAPSQGGGVAKRLKIWQTQPLNPLR